MAQKHAAPADEHKRHQLVWTVLRPLMRLICWLRMGYRALPADVQGPFLLVANHVTYWDPILAGCSFGQQMYFVASEHILRSRPFGKLITWLQDPIPRQKGGSATSTVLTMMRRLKKGENVAIFPEGNRCWDGLTRPFLPSIGKLARTSGAKLVTYRFIGGYFTSPRWAGADIRRGKMRGSVVRVYSPEELKGMTPDEINEHIREDLSEDAYERARKNPIRFRGRRLAEHMERLLFICPRCGRMHTLQSQDDTVKCWKCGFSFRYLPTGFLAGKDLPYDNIRDWSRWQDGEIRRACDEAAVDRPIFSDTDVYSHEVMTARDSTPLGKGEMKLYPDRIEIPGVTIPLSELSGISLMGGQDLYLGANGRSYLVRSSFTRCMVKYLTACAYLNNNADYGV